MRDTLSYLAGLIDGEGWLGFKTPGGKFFCPSPAIEITTTTPRLTDWLQSACGGSSKQQRRLTVVGKHIYRWTISGQKAIDLIGQVRPYLVEKQLQAWLLLEYWATRKTSRGDIHPPTADDIALRHGFVAALQTANSRGSR